MMKCPIRWEAALLMSKRDVLVGTDGTQLVGISKSYSTCVLWQIQVRYSLFVYNIQFEFLRGTYYGYKRCERLVLCIIITQLAKIATVPVQKRIESVHGI
jgi:hypothetical protein